MSQKDLAQIIGVTPSAVTLWESGVRFPRGKALSKLAKALGVSQSYLLDDSEVDQDTSTIEKLIGKRVMEARIEAKLSQSELASNAKTSLTTINRLERGHQFPNKNTRADIAAALNMSEAELFLDLSETESHPKTRQELIGDIVLALAALDESQLGLAFDSIEAIRLGPITSNAVTTSRAK